MKNRIAATLTAALIVATSAVAEDAPKTPNRYDAVLELVEKEFLRPVTREELEERALRAFLQDLDPYSTYMNANEWTNFEADFAGSFGGLGINMRIDPEVRLPVIRYLMIGSSAGDAGVRRGDHLVSIGGRALEGMPIDDVIPLLRGTPGTMVDVTIRHAGSTELVPLKIARRVVKTPSVRGARRDAAGVDDYMLDASKGIGFIRILSFGDDTLGLVEKALAEATRLKMKGLVLDLRDSIGGKMKVAVATADLFLDGGRVVTVVSQRTSDKRHFDATPGVATAVPIVMLVDGGTVSSSEIFAGALADHKRAVVIGQRTFGKGRIQDKIALAPGLGGIVLSTATFQRPSGKTIDKHDAKSEAEAGIAPDEGMEVRLEKDEQEGWRSDMSRLDAPMILTADEQQLKAPDRVLAKALEVLEGLMAKR